jgi:glycosyltransferase involved in cell wall biosynthesis
MRVLILADHWGELGGGEVVAAQLAAALGDHFELGVLSTDRRRDVHERRDGLDIFRLRSSYPARLRPFATVANPLTLRGVGQVLDDFRPDVVHAWNVHQHLSYASLAVARRRGIPTVLTFQDALPFCYTKYHCYIDRGAPCPARPDYRANPRSCRSCRASFWLFPPRNASIRALLSRSVSRRVAVSRALAEALADNELGQADVIHNGLPLGDLPPPADAVEAMRGRLELGDEVVVSGGRMGFFKGQHLLLEAFAVLARRRPAAQLVFAGRDDDWYVKQLKQRASDLGLQQRVRFSGFLPRPEFLALLAAGAVFANLSVYLDPFPTVNLEAGAAARPVLGTCFGGTPEVVLDQKTGLIVDPYAQQEVVAGLERLLSEPSLRANLGRRAESRIRAEFPLERMANTYARLFRSLDSP